MRRFLVLALCLSGCDLFLDVDSVVLLPNVDMNQGDASDMASDMVEDSNLPDLPDLNMPDTPEDLPPDLPMLVCPGGAYETSAGSASTDRVCSACDVGTYCAGGSASPVVCATGTWDHDSSPATVCEAWQNCSAGDLAADGNTTTDRTCTECVSGTYSTTTNASSCAAWTECVFGEYRNGAPTSSSDRVCEGCAVGTYSDTANAPSCTLWTLCGVDEYVFLEGTPTTDRQCALLKEVGEACAANAECANNECQRGYCKLPGFSVIPSGTYTQGSPVGEVSRDSDETERVVTLSHAFFLQETEVTQDEWLALMGNNPANFQSSASGNAPVERVSWWDAIAYMNARSVDEGLQQCYAVTGCSGTPGVAGYSCTSITFVGLSCTGYRLPTEAEWEYAARAGTTTSTYAGAHSGGVCDASSILSDIAWWCGNATSTTHNVGEKTVNAWGLYDMIGNVWEWNWDWYAAYAAGSVTDPTGPTMGSGGDFGGRVFRGCSYFDGASGCRAARRRDAVPTGRGPAVGFRTARSIL